MKIGYRILILLVFYNLCFAYGNARTIQPIERPLGKLNISIDPRFELLLTVQSLSNNLRVNRNLQYSKDALNYFSEFSTHKSVELTDTLSKYFWAEDPIEFALRLSQPYELRQELEYPNNLKSRKGEDILEQYRQSLKEFAEVSDFNAFWNKKTPFYNQVLDFTIAEAGNIDLVKVLEDYFNDTHESYDVILVPSFIGGIGLPITDSLGRQKLYSAVAAEDLKDGIPYMNRENLLYLVWHEFGHSFVNPMTDQYANRVEGASADSLYKPIRSFMLRNGGYVNWHICVNELVIRAIGVRLLELNLGSEEAEKAMANEIKSGFIYIEPLVEKLKEYEVQRDENNITFAEFYPQLLDLFDDLEKNKYWTQFDLSYNGPTFGVLLDDKLAVVYPTQDLDAEALKVVQEQATDMFNFVKQFRQDVIIIEDIEALDTNLEDYGILAYGTIESNAFLKHYASTFPFRIENETIYADREYTDPNIKFITWVPNPFNPLKGMIIHTGLSNRALQDINESFKSNLLFLSEDYIFFLNEADVINKGFFKKEDKWLFP